MGTLNVEDSGASKNLGAPRSALAWGRPCALWSARVGLYRAPSPPSVQSFFRTAMIRRAGTGNTRGEGERGKRIRACCCSFLAAATTTVGEATIVKTLKRKVKAALVGSRPVRKQRTRRRFLEIDSRSALGLFCAASPSLLSSKLALPFACGAGPCDALACARLNQSYKTGLRAC